MLLQSISKDFCFSLNAAGNRIYKEMRDAEDEWMAATRFHMESVGGRKFILIATHERLPSLERLQATRDDFLEYIQSLPKEQQSLGTRATEMPIWILPDPETPNAANKVPITEKIDFDDTEPALIIALRRNNAWRSQHLDQQQTTQMIEQKIESISKSIVIYQKNYNHKRAREMQEKLETWIETRAFAVRIFQEFGPKLTARKRSGKGLKITVKTKNCSYTTTIANVALVVGTTKTKILEVEPNRDRITQLKEVAEIANFVFFIPRENGGGHEPAIGNRSIAQS